MKVGDEVTWTHIQRRSTHSATLTTRSAKIIHLSENNVAVKFRGKLINLRPDQTRLSNEKNELTEMVMDSLGIKNDQN
jgi:plastocyanin